MEFFTGILMNVALVPSIADPDEMSNSVTSHMALHYLAMSVMIWVQTACKGHQQTTKDAASKERIKQLELITEKVLLSTQNRSLGCK